VRDATVTTASAAEDPAPGVDGERPTAAVPPGAPDRPGRGTDLLALAVAVAIGLGTAWSLWPRGGVTAGTALLVAVAPVVVSAAWRLKSARTWLALLALWWVATFLTEFLVHDPLRQVGYALSRPPTVALSFCGALWVLRQGRTVARAYIVSVLAGLAMATLLYPSAHLRQDPWKYGYGPVATLAVVLLSALLLRRRRRGMAAALLLAIAMVSLILGFRSEFLVTALAVMVSVVTRHRSAGSRRSYLLTGGALCALAVGLYAGYGYLASNGGLGAQQQTRWEKQSRVEGGLLMGARPESLASLSLIADASPVGLGVSPEVDEPTRAAFLQRLRQLGIKVHEGTEAYYFSRGLYLHSVLFQAWAESGVLAVPALLFPLLLVVRALLSAVRRESVSGALVFCFVFSQLAWDTLFSPWPRLHAVYLGTAAAAAVVYLARRTHAAKARIPPAPTAPATGQRDNRNNRDNRDNRDESGKRHKEVAPS
jgi:hypothetical protein